MSSRQPANFENVTAAPSVSVEDSVSTLDSVRETVATEETAKGIEIDGEAVILPVHACLMRQLQRRFNSTLDPTILWHQATQQLGQALGLSCCIAYSYEPDRFMLPLVAAYGLAASQAEDSFALPLDAHAAVATALAQPQPVVLDDAKVLLEAIGSEHNAQIGIPDWADHSAVLVPVMHLGAPRGLLLLHRSASQPWTASEKLLLEDIGDSLGAAITHSTAQRENHALAQKFQQVKDDFLYKHKEIEEAHREAELAYQEAEEASRLKSEFLANTSHELRTPLNGMIGFLKLVIDGMADTEEELHEFVGEAHNSALLLLDIINDILDVAKIEAGKMELDLSVVQLNELFEDVSKKTRRQALARNLLYEITPPKTHDEVIVYGDYQRLLQVLLNLVGNALKFTHSGSITISSRIIEKMVLVNDEELPGLLEIRVADTGIGVSLDQQAKLFKSFSQVDGSRTRQYGGTGLGLVISQKLVEAMGGEVHFYSMGEELGSTVTFTVPLYQKPVMQAATESELEDAEMGIF